MSDISNSSAADTAKKAERIGPYILEECLGRGGMGEVYRAYDNRLRRWVAIKHVLAKDAENANLRQRFRREARTVARLNHSAIVQIYDILETTDGDWIVMELVEGSTVRKLMDENSLTLPSTYSIARQVAGGLAVAHKEGVVHRDLKVENVMVTSAGSASAGSAKILDFGLAKRVVKRDPTDTSLSGTGMVVGTFRSMSPEQIMDQVVDSRSDLFSFGTMLYEMCTGQSPFKADTVVTTMTQVCRHQQTPAEDFDKNIPRELSDFIDRLLEKEPARRPQDALEVVRFFDRLTGETTMLPHVEIWEPAPAGPVGPSKTDSAIDFAPTEPMKTAYLSRKEESGVGKPRSKKPVTPDESGFVIKTLVAVERLEETAPRMDQILGQAMVEHSGLLLDSNDPGLLMFERPAAAVEFALACNRQLAALSHELQQKISGRFGIHLGEVSIAPVEWNEATRYSEDAIVLRRTALKSEWLEEEEEEITSIKNFTPLVTRNVMALARPGQILLTQSVDELVQRGSVGHLLGEQEVGWRDHGLYTLPGMNDEVEIFEVGWVGDAPFQAPKARWPSPSTPASPLPVTSRPKYLELGMLGGILVFVLVIFLWFQGWFS